MIIHLPPAASLDKIPMISSEALASSPEVGSSRKRTEGFATSSIAMFTRFFSPPDKPLRYSSPIAVFCRSNIPRSKSTFDTISLISSAE
mmetsp:Transcript_31070/g.43540  ORF Transcript_31070/g.43540 Transcript_31070/m.43540 type:complete len:89 (-) Transcript_31070:813-1079(-)